MMQGDKTMQEKGQLIRWVPLQGEVFDRFMKPMYLENLEFDGELRLTVGSENNRYQFAYERTERFYFPIRAHRIHLEFVRHDLEERIGDFIGNLKVSGQPLSKYNHTFYKVANSSYLEEYLKIDDSIPDFEIAALEHHLYITDDYFIDVLANVQPTIKKL